MVYEKGGVKDAYIQQCLFEFDVGFPLIGKAQKFAIVLAMLLQSACFSLIKIWYQDFLWLNFVVISSTKYA